MDSSANQTHSRAKIVSKQCDTLLSSIRRPSSRRTSSFSSSASLSPCSSLESSYFSGDSPISPATPFRFSGVPFSWEHLPGIPKRQSSKKNESSLKLLPLPPPTILQASKKYNQEETQIRNKNPKKTLQKDPFFAALVECSKGDDDDDGEEDREGRSGTLWDGAKVTRSLSDRFGFINLYASCKRTCAVSESIIHLPSSRSRSYGNLPNRP